MAVASVFPFMELAVELRDSIYEELLEHETAVILPHTFKPIPGSAGVTQSTTQDSTKSELIITSSDRKLNSISRNFRSEYLKTLKRRTLALKIDGIFAYVLDMNFDQLENGLLRRLTAGAYEQRHPDLSIQIAFCFSKDFREHDIELNEHDTSYGRWLRYRDQTAAEGKRIEMQYAVGPIHLRNQEPIRTFIDVYKRFVYKDKDSVEMDQVMELFTDHFLNDVKWSDVSRPEDEETEDEESEEDSDEDGVDDQGMEDADEDDDE